MATDPGASLLSWLEHQIEWRPTNAADAWYEHMASQSGECLPLIYQPFDGRQRMHFVDRAQILDYALTLGDGRLLDFGPGDGWPSLMMAPYCREVVGVDASARRVAVCRRNAERLGIDNATFVHVPAGEPLPFADSAFDGVAAASSIEQTPDPVATLRELFRVLRPGGRLRMHYESLSTYAGGQERELGWQAVGDERSLLLLFDRRIAAECVDQYGLVYDLPVDALVERLGRDGEPPTTETLTIDSLDGLREHLVEAISWTTRHPSCATWLTLLREVGFEAQPMHSGGVYAYALFERLGREAIPESWQDVDAMLRPLVAGVIELPAPRTPRVGPWEPMITATKPC